jgi:hypothetical protein
MEDRMTCLLAACGGFLSAVLWMDLMFDVQVRQLDRGPSIRDAALASIAAYYRRVTTAAFPMNRLIAAVMTLLVAGAAYRAFQPATAGIGASLALVLGGAPVALAALRIVPAAVRLGERTDETDAQVALARSIFRGHVLCFVAMTLFTALHVRA